MKWRNWRKIASLWRFELDAKSGLLETGDSGENGDFGENRPRAGDNGEKRSGPWRLAIVAKLAIFASDIQNVANIQNGIPKVANIATVKRALLEINPHFCRFRRCVHFWTYLLSRRPA